MNLRAGFCLFLALAAPAKALEPIPDKLVVLTFDDSSKSHFTVARPVLKKYGFGASGYAACSLERTRDSRPMSWALGGMGPRGGRLSTPSHSPTLSRYVRFEAPEGNWRTSSSPPGRPSMCSLR